MKDKVLTGTKSELIDIMKCGGEISVQQGAETLGLAATTIRQHLATLVDQGFVTTRNKRYGRGRPLKMYSLTEDSQVWYENRDPDLLAELVEFLLARGESALLESFFQKVTDDSVSAYEAFSRSHEGSPIDKLRAFLREHGYVMDDSPGDDDTFRVGLCHCPFRGATEVTDLPCRAEQAFLESVLGRELDRVSHIASGDLLCDYRDASEPEPS